MRRRRQAPTPSPTDPPPPYLDVIISSTRDVDLLEGTIESYRGGICGIESVTIRQTNGAPFTIPWRGVKWRPANQTPQAKETP